MPWLTELRAGEEGGEWSKGTQGDPVPVHASPHPRGDPTGWGCCGCHGSRLETPGVGRAASGVVGLQGRGGPGPSQALPGSLGLGGGAGRQDEVGLP